MTCRAKGVNTILSSRPCGVEARFSPKHDHSVFHCCRPFVGFSRFIDMEQTQIQSDIQSSQTEEWTYLAEGGAHLVFAYHGTASSLRNKVLRVRKSHVESPTCGTFEEGITTFERARVYFANTITPVLVPPELLPEEWRVSVRTDWIRALEADSLSLRPKSRTSLRSSLSGDQQSTSDESVEVSLVENLLGAEGDVAIEIKVRSSVSPSAIPNTPSLTPESFDSQNADSYRTLVF
jgi:hypothetical protein